MESFVVDGYKFRARNDYEKALKEKETVAKFNVSILNMSVDELIRTYNKLTSKSYFTTPIGMDFLKKLRDEIESKSSDTILNPIPVTPQTRKINGVPKADYDEAEEIIFKQNNIRTKLMIALAALTVLIFGMIYVMATNPNTGYLNAEDKVLDKYASWEEQLNVRERELIEREDRVSEYEEKYGLND